MHAASLPKHSMKQSFVMSVSILQENIVVKICLPASLRRFADNRNEVVVDAMNVGDALNALISDYPRLQSQIYAGDGTLRRFINIFLNAENIRDLDGEATAITARAEITLLPALAGG